MHVTSPTPCSNVGFLSVQQEPSGFVGGYLVTNAWGRPLEFRVSSAVQPNKVQTILYGDTLQSYLCEVIGKTLIDKTATPVQWVLVDNPVALDLRLRVEVPVGLWYPIVDPEGTTPGLLVRERLYCHARYPEDVAVLRELLDRVGQLDLAEPFVRIREAMAEARKMGVTTRAAA
jgi:hypothetical protein